MLYLFLLSTEFQHFQVLVSGNQVNIINYVYSVEDTTLPVGFDVIKKPIKFCEVKTKKEKRRATVTKNQMTRNQLKICQRNQLKYKYVLAQPRMGQTAARRLGGFASALVFLQRKYDFYSL